MQEIINQNQPVDLVTLTDLLEKQGTLEQAGGIAYITELTNVMPSSANYNRYSEIVTRDSLMRRLIKSSAEIIENCKTSSDKMSALSFAENNRCSQWRFCRQGYDIRDGGFFCSHGYGSGHDGGGMSDAGG
jgi:replicative DNA helicase